RNFLVAYERTLEDGTVLDFIPVQDNGATILEDNEGGQWNIFGEAVSGPRIGTNLKGTSSYIGFWFAWATFQEGIEIYQP
ncbi:MAG: hypothetical protein AAFO07_31460, partial [Bacteroidota bacterium]